MNDPRSWQAWRELNLRELADSDESGPGDSWRVIALAACGRSDAVSAMRALTDLEGYEHEGDLAGRSVASWLELGRRYVDSCLRAVGAAPRHQSKPSCAYPRLFSEPLAEIALGARRGGADLVAFAKSLSTSRDPLLWWEAPPVLARLAVAQGDRDALAPLTDLADDAYVGAPWRELVATQARRLKESRLPKLPAASWTALSAETEARDVAALLGCTSPPESIQSLAGVQAQLDPDHQRSAIVRLHPEALERALQSNAIVVVHEERSVHPGFARIWAFDRDADRVLVDSMNVIGAELRTWSEQEQLMAHYGNAALLCWSDRKPAEAAPLAHDEALAMIGATEADRLDPSAGRARQELLARIAVDACPDVPRAWQLHGQALLAQLKAEELESENDDGPIERWYASARTRFARAEWALQVYAQTLESWGLMEEAAIAWNDAYALDEDDVRNLIGIARTRAREGLLASAEGPARDALATDPSALDAWRLQAELAMSGGDHERAETASSVVLEVHGDDATAHGIVGSCAELKGELELALAHFDRAASQGGVRYLARGSVTSARMGDFEGAQGRAMAALDRDPEDYSNHLRASECFARLGEYEDSVGILDFALSRFGPHRPLVQAYGQRISTLLSPDECAERVRDFVESWAEYDTPLISLGNALSSGGYLELAVACFDAAQRLDAHALNPRWQKVQCFMRNERRSEAADLLDSLLPETELPHMYALWTELRGADDLEASWSALERADATQEPVLAWGSAHFVADEREDTRAVEALTERLMGVPAQSFSSAIGFLLHNRAALLANHLLGLYERHPGAERRREDLLHLRSKHAFLRRDFDEVADLLAEMHREFPDSIVTWEEMSMVLVSGRADALRALSDKAIRNIMTGAPSSFGDGYVERGYRAAADALAGDIAPLEALLGDFPHHLGVRECAVRASYGRFADHADQWGATLEEIAPGLHRKTLNELARA